MIDGKEIPPDLGEWQSVFIWQSQMHKVTRLLRGTRLSATVPVFYTRRTGDPVPYGVYNPTSDVSLAIVNTDNEIDSGATTEAHAIASWEANPPGKKRNLFY